MERGEKQGRREAMDRMTGDLIKQGVPKDRAQQIAKQSAIRADHREEDRRR